MSDIIWPSGYLPGYTDNFCSNEVIVRGVQSADLWHLLSNPALWPSYYANSANVCIEGGMGPQLEQGTRFYFETFGFPVNAEVLECVAPVAGQPARIAWHGWAGHTPDDRLDVHHAWLIEDLPGDRVRILTQETQIGKPAQTLAMVRPNPMINGHQDWLDGMVAAARTQVRSALAVPVLADQPR